MNSGNASPGDPMLGMTMPRCERRQSLCSALAAFAFLLSIMGDVSAQQAGGQAPAAGAVPKQAAPAGAPGAKGGAEAAKPPAVKSPAISANGRLFAVSRTPRTISRLAI